MTKDLIRLRETAEKFFKLLPCLIEFRLYASPDELVAAGADGDPYDKSPTDNPLVEALNDFLVAVRDAGLDKEGTFERYAEERERRREIGKTIDPATAEVQYCRSINIDPYDMIPVYEWRAENGSESKWTMFARNPGGAWVVREDLPDDTRGALEARQRSSCSNGCIDIIRDACEEVASKDSYRWRWWYAPTYEPCSSGVRVNIESHDGAETAIEFSLDDPQACVAVKQQLTAFFGEA